MQTHKNIHMHIEQLKKYQLFEISQLDAQGYFSDTTITLQIIKLRQYHNSVAILEFLYARSRKRISKVIVLKSDPNSLVDYSIHMWRSTYMHAHLWNIALSAYQVLEGCCCVVHLTPISCFHVTLSLHQVVPYKRDNH